MLQLLLRRDVTCGTSLCRCVLSPAQVDSPIPLVVVHLRKSQAHVSTGREQRYPRIVQSKGRNRCDLCFGAGVGKLANLGDAEGGGAPTGDNLDALDGGVGDIRHEEGSNRSIVRVGYAMVKGESPRLVKERIGDGQQPTPRRFEDLHGVPEALATHTLPVSVLMARA